MDESELKKKLQDMKAPEPAPERKAEALKAATGEFKRARAEERVKGIADERRLTGKEVKKTWFTGGPVMRRTLAFTAVGASLVIALAIVLPAFMGQKEKAHQRYTQPPATTSGYPASSPATQEIKGGEPQPAVKHGAGTVTPHTAPAADKEQLASATPRMKDAKADSMAASEVRLASPAPSASAPHVAYDLNKAEGAGRALDMAAPGMAIAPPEPYPGQPYEEYAGRDRFEHKEVNPVKVVKEEPVSTFSIDVDTTSYSFVRRMLNEGNLPQKDAVRVEEMINYFSYDYPRPSDRSRPFATSVAVYPTPWNPDTLLLHIGIKGHEAIPAERPRANLVFLLDVSGSMSSPDKLPLLKNAFRMFVDTLRPDDTVAIAVYAGASGTVLEPTKVSDKGKIIAALEMLQAGGSTAGAEGLKLAYALAEANFDPKAINRVFLATDGDFNVGITSTDELTGFIERKRATGIYLSVLGFGQGNYNDALMQKLAQNGNGAAAYIDTINEARKVLVDEATSAIYPIAKDVKIQVEFNPSRVAEYRLIGYETRLLKREDFNNDQVDAGEIGSGHSVTAIYEITPVGSPARMVDDLRYGAKDTKPAADKSAEYALLRIRYKLPKEDASRLIERPIGNADEKAKTADAPAEMRFAASVAAFGQILKGSPYTKGFTYDDVLSLAGAARGTDAFGYRAEFLNLVRLAKSARTMGDR